MVGITFAFGLVLMLAATAFAEIFGLFPGIDGLVAQADSIAVLRVIPPRPPDPNAPYDPTNGTVSGVTHATDVEFLNVLKGDIQPGTTATVGLGVYGSMASDLRELPAGARIQSRLGKPFVAPGTYLAFFYPHRTLINCEGSLLRVAGSRVNLAKADRETTADLIRRLLSPQ